MTVLNYQIPASVATVERNAKRLPTVAGAVTAVNRYVDQRIGQAAESLSLGAILQSRIALVNQALVGLIDLLYEMDESGHPVNVDRVTGRILIPLPWGADGWKYWRLRNHEARVLRRVMDRRMRTGERTAMFMYDGESNRWHVTKRYGHKEAAFAYLQNNPITATEWRVVAGKTRH